MMAQQTLTHRGVIKITGQDKADFLQGIITNDVRLIDQDKAIYSCFLTPQGKYLADFFIVAKGDDWLLDVDHSLLDDLIRRMSMYKLRSKVTLDDVSQEYKVIAYWDHASQIPDGVTKFKDPRTPDIGWRAIVPSQSIVIKDEDDYNLWRLQKGVPDTGDFIRERSMMLECNMDLLNALSWDKGCYMGQELTARTHYRALIKKRLIPLRFSEPVALPFDAEIRHEEKAIGTLRSSHNGYGLGLINLEAIKENPKLMVAGYHTYMFFPNIVEQLQLNRAL